MDYSQNLFRATTATFNCNDSNKNSFNFIQHQFIQNADIKYYNYNKSLSSQKSWCEFVVFVGVGVFGMFGGCVAWLWLSECLNVSILLKFVSCCFCIVVAHFFQLLAIFLKVLMLFTVYDVFVVVKLLVVANSWLSGGGKQQLYRNSHAEQVAVPFNVKCQSKWMWENNKKKHKKAITYMWVNNK